MQQVLEGRVGRGQQRHQPGEGHRAADPPALGGFLDGVQLGDPAHLDEILQRLELLGGLEPQVGGAGDQPGLGPFGLELSQRLEGPGRRVVAGLGGLGGDGPVVQALAEGGIGEPGGVGRRVVAHGERRLADRPVAGAAAEVAAEGRLEARLGQRGGRLVTISALLLVEGEERHHDARRAEAALAAMAVDHRRLGGVQALALGQPLHGHQVAALELVGRGDAGVGTAIDELAGGVRLADGHGAGPAVAGGAALLGAGLAEGRAQQFEHALVGAHVGTALAPAVEVEVDHGRLRCGCHGRNIREYLDS